MTTATLERPKATLADVNRAFNLPATEPAPALNPGVLATLPAAAQLDKQQLAQALGIKQRALEQRMAKKQLPAPFKLGRKCVWLAGHLTAWFENQAREAERRAKR